MFVYLFIFLSTVKACPQLLNSYFSAMRCASLWTGNVGELATWGGCEPVTAVMHGGSLDTNFGGDEFWRPLSFPVPNSRCNDHIPVFRTMRGNDNYHHHHHHHHHHNIKTIMLIISWLTDTMCKIIIIIIIIIVIIAITIIIIIIFVITIITIIHCCQHHH